MPDKVKNSYKRKQVQVDPEILPKVLEVVELIVKSKKKNVPKDIYSITFETCDKVRSKKIGREYVELITACISNHRYKEAVKLLWMICLDKSISHIFIFKAVMIIFNNLEFEYKDSAMSLLIKSLIHFKQLNRREVVLEYMLYSLKNDCSNNVLQEFSSLLKKESLRKNVKIDLIVEAYNKLKNYIDWCQLYYSGSSQSNCEHLRILTLAAYKLLFQNPGHWDIFILKLIEMLESCDEHKEIEDLLLENVNTNPHDINGYIYLCVYFYYNNPNSDNFIKYLEILSDMCPSDPRILWLFEIWSTQGKELTKCLRHIFMFLDYPSNGKNIVAWRLLSQNLYQATVNATKKELKVIKHLWKSRSGSWKWMYFNPSRVLQFDVCDSLLIAHRVVVISFFDSEHIFIKEMQENFPNVANLVSSLKEQIPFSEEHLFC